MPWNFKPFFLSQSPPILYSDVSLRKTGIRFVRRPRRVDPTLPHTHNILYLLYIGDRLSNVGTGSSIASEASSVDRLVSTQYRGLFSFNVCTVAAASCRFSLSASCKLPPFLFHSRTWLVVGSSSCTIPRCRKLKTNENDLKKITFRQLFYYSLLRSPFVRRLGRASTIAVRCGTLRNYCILLCPPSSSYHHRFNRRARRWYYSDYHATLCVDGIRRFIRYIILKYRNRTSGRSDSNRIVRHYCYTILDNQLIIVSVKCYAVLLHYYFHRRSMVVFFYDRARRTTTNSDWYYLIVFFCYTFAPFPSALVSRQQRRQSPLTVNRAVRRVARRCRRRDAIIE